MAETDHDDLGLRSSIPNAAGPQGAAGGMGVSSERVGHTGPGQRGTDGLKSTSPAAAGDTEATGAGDCLAVTDGGPTPAGQAAPMPPEQRPGGVEPKPVGLPPKAAPDPDSVGR